MAVLNLRPIVGGRILRGSQPFDMDAAETSAFLEQHGIRAVVDLRTEYERAIVPWPGLNGASPSGTESNELGSSKGVEFLDNPLEPRTGIESLGTIVTAEELGGLYLGWVRERPEWVAESLRPVAQGKRTLIHCSLGKDRTGVIAAVALLASGADHQTVVDDYTATTPELPQMLSLMAAAWRLAVPAMPEQVFSPELMILQSPEAAMNTFLAGFAAEFGDAAGYLRDAGLSGVELDALRAA